MLHVRVSGQKLMREPKKETEESPQKSPRASAAAASVPPGIAQKDRMVPFL